MAKRNTYVKWMIGAGFVVLVLACACWLASPALSRAAQRRLVSALEQHFGGSLEMRSLRVSLFPRLRIDGEEIVLRNRERTDVPPLITIRKLSGNGSIFGLLRGHFGAVRLEGLLIQIPPPAERSPRTKQQSGAKAKDLVIDEIVADGTTLITLPKDPDKQPLEWDIERLTMSGAGVAASASFRATLINAKPPGRIQSSGKFGPWNAQEPGETPVSGDYTFQDADLSVFNGIAGILSSQGRYRGELGRIEVDGATDTPDFMVKVSGHPVHLATQFHAVVDGTDGDTWLQPVNAQFGHSSVVAQGSVTGVKGVPGKTVTLDAAVQDGRMEDMLYLGVKGDPAMSGAVSFQTKIVIPPGNVEIAEKLQLAGTFAADAATFSQLNVQEQVNKLSHSGSGEPTAPETDTVASDFKGSFTLNRGLMTFQNLSFRVPGVAVSLNGSYGLLDQKLDLRGRAVLEAELSQTTTGFKSVLLKALNPFFKKKNAGAVIPIHIGGTRDQPSFGLDIGRG